MGRVSDAKERLMDAVLELIWTNSYGSTTIDQICDKAGVKKGSFYYFFDSKVDLAEAAISEEWKSKRQELDSLFSPTVPPLESLKNYCDFGYRMQADIKAKYGCVLGCPLFSVGAEISTEEDRLQKKIQAILEYKRKYFESAIRDAHAAGLIYAPDAESSPRAFFLYSRELRPRPRKKKNFETFGKPPRGFSEMLG